MPQHRFEIRPPSVSALVTRHVLTVAAAHGVDRSALLHAAGLGEDDLTGGGGRIGLIAHQSILSLAATWSAVPDFGLRLGESFEVASLGLPGHLAVHGPTLGSALADLSRHWPLVTDSTTMRLTRDREHATIEVRERTRLMPVPAVVQELMSAGLLRICRTLAGSDVRLSGVSFIAPRPRDRRAFERTFDAPVEFGQRAVVLSLPSGLLELPLVYRDSAAHKHLSEACERMSCRLGVPRLFADRVREAMRGSMDGHLQGMTDCAGSLGVSIRSLQRHLAAEGTTFARLADAERRALCMDLLGQTDLSLKEIAFVSEFGSAGAFHRAFRRWSGTTPTRYRAEARERGYPLHAATRSDDPRVLLT